MPAHADTTGSAHPITFGISPTLTLPGAGTVTWINFTSATLCSSYHAITVNSGQTFPFSCALPAQGGMIQSISLSLSTNWKNICPQFPLKICAWIPQWTITPLTGSSKKGRYGHSSTSMTNAAGQKQFLMSSPLTKMELLYVRKNCA